jgi:hypothetical protein
MPRQKSWASSITLYNRSFFFFSDVSRLIESMAREERKKGPIKNNSCGSMADSFFLNIYILPAAVIV